MDNTTTLPPTIDADQLAQLLRISRKRLLMRVRAGSVLAPNFDGRAKKAWLTSEVLRWLEAGSPNQQDWRRLRKQAMR